MYHHLQITSGELKKMITAGQIRFGGNGRLKIYGTLSCSSGKRMKKQNRGFFKDESEAIQHGFRPCGHCLKAKYLKWIEQVSG
jgi:methylphosphotriester-DNA--protein-cysteine methyltransferase